MSTFRGNATQIPSIGPQGQNSPAIYNAIAGHHNQHAQHSPIVQNDTLVGNALKTVGSSFFKQKLPPCTNPQTPPRSPTQMYPTDQSISSYGSNPTTPVNSPPPLTSQQQAAAAAAQQQHAAPVPSAASVVSIAGSSGAGGGGGPGPSVGSSSAIPTAAAAAAWQQISNPVINNGGGGAGSAAVAAAAAAAAAAALSGLPNGSYAPELVHRGLQHMVIV